METTPPAVPGPKFVSYTLDAPIVRGEHAVTELRIRKPTPGDCRGLKLSDLGNGDVTALIKLLPRITDPVLTEQEAALLDLADMAEIAGIIVDFLFTKARRADLPTTH